MEQRQGYFINSDRDSTNQKRPLTHTANCILYLLSGNGCFSLGDHTLPLVSGQCCFIPCGSTARYWSEGEWEYVWIEFEGELFDEILSKVAFSPENPVCKATEEQAALFVDISNRKYSSHGGEYYYTLGLAVQLLSSLAISHPSEKQLAEDGSMRSVLAFIHSNLYRADLSVEYLAQVTGVGRTTLYHRFKKEVGCSPSEYIQKRRISTARHLLRTEKMSVRSVAAAVGYDDPLYFSRVFHKATKCSPTHYRRFFHRMESENKVKEEDQ